MALTTDVFYLPGNTYISYQICGARFKEGSKLLCRDVPNHVHVSHTHYTYTMVDGEIYYNVPQSSKYFSAPRQLSLFSEYNLTAFSYLYWYPSRGGIIPSKDFTKQQFYDIFWKDNSYKGYFPLPFKIAFDKMLNFKDDDSPYPTNISDEALANDPENYKRYKELKAKYNI